MLEYGTTRWLSIIDHVQAKPRHNAWDVVFKDHMESQNDHYGETEQQYRDRHCKPAWQKARECHEMGNADSEPDTGDGNDAEHYDVSYDDEIERQAAETADAMNQHGCQMMEQRPPTTASPPPIAKNAAPSAYDKIKEEWRKRTEENNAEMERISNVQKQQYEDMKKMAGTFETLLEEKMGKLFTDVTAIIRKDRVKANLAQADLTSKMESLLQMFATMTASLTRIEQSKRNANDEPDEPNAARRQRLAITDSS